MHIRKIIYSLYLVFIVLGTSGCLTTKPVVMTMPTKSAQCNELKDRVSLKSICDKHKIQWNWDSVSQVIMLKGNHLEAKGLVGSNIVLMGEEKVRLSKSIEIEQSAIMVPWDFKRKVLMRLVPPKTVLRKSPNIRKIRKVLIDPGHGGRDPGAIGVRGSKEKDVVLKIAKRMKEVLSPRGFEVELTRDIDKFLTLEQRTEVASREKADIFISIHANASKAKRASGIEVFSLRNLSVSEVNSDQRKRNQYLLFKNFAMQPDNHLKSILSDILYDHKRFQDDLLAAYAAKKLSKHARARNRGDKKSGFFVLKNTIMPAILVEVGFISNPREERLLNSKMYQDKVARSLAQVIIDYNKYSDEELCRIVQSEY